MATLKYRDRKGAEHVINPYQVHNVVISQEKGDSPIDVMSQEATSKYLDELENKINELGGNTEEKFGNYYTKEEVDQQHKDIEDNANQALEDYKKEVDERFTSNEGNVDDLTQKVEDLETKHGEDLNTTNKKVEDLEKKHDEEIEAVNQSINDLENDLRDELTSAGKEIDDLTELHNQDVLEINESISNLDTKVDNAINDLNDSITELSDNHSQDVEEINGAIDAINSDLSALTEKEASDVADLQKKDEELTKQHEKDVLEINQSISDLNTNLNDLKTKEAQDVANINSTLTEIKDDITVFKAKEQGDIDGLQSQVDVIGTRVTNTETNISSLRVDLGTLQNKEAQDIAAVNSELTRIESKHDADKTLLNEAIQKAQTGLDEEIIRAKLAEQNLSESMLSLVNDAKYDKVEKKIKFLHDTQVLAWIDASDFVKDGMVSRVRVVGENLEIEFNLDADQETIKIPLTAIFNPDNYYTKEEVDRRVTEINGNITLSNNEITAIKGQLEYYTDKIAEIRTDISHLQDDIVEVRADIAQLKGDKENILTQISQINQDILYINDKITHINDDIDAIKTELATKVGQAEFEREIALLETKYHASTTFATKEEVQEKIDDLSKIVEENEQGCVKNEEFNAALDNKADKSSIADMATKTWVNDQRFLTEHQSLDNYYTKSQVDSEIQQAKRDILGDDLTTTFDTLKAVQDWADEHGTEYSNLVADVDKKANKADLDNYYTKQEVDNKVPKTWVGSADAYEALSPVAGTFYFIEE